MAEVLMTFKILPEGIETDLDLIVEKIRDIGIAKLGGAEKEPIAFGLNALKISLVAEDSGGVIEQIEESLRGIEGISELEMTGVTRLL